ncbi:ABC transporter substrate-binding protein [Pseudogracilibacillus sp. SO30301A]|uniref:ABC transporter substrate-binding protein n=1 Tax=Pseudogracilibacillus sp. SO30301A TaxID=3098291 RepID=UPI00300E3369
MKKFYAFVFMIAFVFVLAACNGEDGEGQEASGEANGGDDAEVYKIGAIYSKTGPNNPLGEPEWNTTELIVEEINAAGGINGIPLEVILADDESTQEKATQEMNRLIHDEEVLAVLGSSGSTESLAMKGIAMEQEVPLVSAAASIQVVEPVEESTWVFKTPQNDVHAVENIYMYLEDEGIEKIGILTDSNAYGESGREQLEAMAEDYGIEIVAKEVYNMEDADMSTQLTKINSSGAEALITWGTNPGPATIAVNMKDLGMEIPHVSSHGVANQAFIDLAQDAAEGVVIPTGRLLFPSEIPEDDPHYEVISDFYEKYTDKYDSEPTNFASYGYDNLMLVVDALEAGATDRASIRDHLENNITDWVGTSGTFNMSSEDHNGLDTDSLVMAHVKKGKWQFLK